MSDQPIPLEDYRRQGDNRIAVEVASEYLGLPAPVMVARPDAVHVTLTDPDDLGTWLAALGGEVHERPAVDGVALWTLHTATPDRGRRGAPVQIRVHVPVVDGEHVLTEVRSAVVA